MGDGTVSMQMAVVPMQTRMAGWFDPGLPTYRQPLGNLRRGTGVMAVNKTEAIEPSGIDCRSGHTRAADDHANSASPRAPPETRRSRG